MPVRYLTSDEITRFFGDPSGFITEDGGISQKWEDKILASFKLPKPLPYCADTTKLIKTVRCHKRILPFLEDVFNDLYSEIEVWASINDFGGCYNWRTQRKSKDLSRHSWGIAVDIDVLDNPMSTAGKMHPRAIEIFRKHRFLWGGNFRTRKDPMHFEFGNLSLLEGG